MNNLLVRRRISPFLPSKKKLALLSKYSSINCSKLNELQILAEIHAFWYMIEVNEDWSSSIYGHFIIVTKERYISNSAMEYSYLNLVLGLSTG